MHLFLTSAMKLEINLKKEYGKSTNKWKLNNLLLNDEWVNQEIRKIKKITWKEMEVKTMAQNLSILKQEETENLDRLITSKEIESVTKKLPSPHPQKSPEPDGFRDGFCHF